MFIKLIVFSLFWAFTVSTRLQFVNYCSDSVRVDQIYYDPFTICELTTGSACYWRSDEWYLMFIQNTNDYEYNNKTGAEISIHADTHDYYSLQTLYGFDLPMQISSDNGPTFTCLDPDCPGSYDHNSDNEASIKSGGTITVTWCPTSVGKDLKLVESVRKPLASRPKFRGQRKMKKVL